MAEPNAAGRAAVDDVVIELVDLHKSFGEHHVLRGMSLSVPRGKVFVVIGRSGEGKSVLLRHILGLVQPDSGDVLVDGVSMVRATSRERRVLLRRFGMLFQNGALFDSMTVFDNVAFPLRESDRRFTRKELRQIVTSKLEQVGLRGIEDKIPAELSGGMRKRVALARAIALDPEILLYDEPTTGLDPVRTQAVVRLILDTAQQLGVTSIVVSHDMQAVFEMADLVTMIYEGKVLLTADPESFRAHPSEVVQSFLHGRPLPDASAGQLGGRA